MICCVHRFLFNGLLLHGLHGGACIAMATSDLCRRDAQGTEWQLRQIPPPPLSAGYPSARLCSDTELNTGVILLRPNLTLAEQLVRVVRAHSARTCLLFTSLIALVHLHVIHVYPQANQPL